MTMIEAPSRYEREWDEAYWQKSKAGYSVHTRHRGWHVSLYRKPNQVTLRFRIDGALPTTSVQEAKAWLWCLLKHLPARVPWAL